MCPVPVTRDSEEIELTIVLPCLNEAETIGGCVRYAWQALRDSSIRGEVIVADNGSSDGSQKIAEGEGARVVAVRQRGYGNALQGDIAASKGQYILMGDADGSYDFSHAGRFLGKLREG